MSSMRVPGAAQGAAVVPPLLELLLVVPLLLELLELGAPPLLEVLLVAELLVPPLLELELPLLVPPPDELPPLPLSA